MSLPNEHAGGKLSCVPEGGRGLGGVSPGIPSAGGVGAGGSPVTQSLAVWPQDSGDPAWPGDRRCRRLDPPRALWVLGPERGAQGLPDQVRGLFWVGCTYHNSLRVCGSVSVSSFREGQPPHHLVLPHFHYAGKSPEPSPRQPNPLWSLWIDPMSHAARFH